ncbi:diacylglycerol kinase family protein [Alkalihalobacillus sp. MEB130]|uniref:diacylglycerol kinase family protein n=1 Tax=Alkalihalobacillus sp. MEB130 TaxID=2976704 RepID=UPI0028DD4816|nr:diacylglycerol kinase family protein [Alkalihalobacillus sp. MEB130]MDT8861783.1 diacylglycerol kinase family protein [Alkalihalobacillus sp. MEB130]
MGLQDRNKRGFKRLLRSFSYASQGFGYVVKNEQNMQIHLVVATITLLAAFLLDFPVTHWLLLLIVIAGMFALEIMNTAIERTVDLVTEEFHPLAKRAKDIAAAAVFVYCLFAVIIGCILFIPALLALF